MAGLPLLAQVLQLDELATSYLVTLAHERQHKPARRVREIVPSGIRQLLDVLQQPDRTRPACSRCWAPSKHPAPA